MKTNDDDYEDDLTKRSPNDDADGLAPTTLAGLHPTPKRRTKLKRIDARTADSRVLLVGGVRIVIDPPESAVDEVPVAPATPL